MEEQHLRHIQNVLARRGRKPSGLHDHIKLIKLAYEGDLGVPTICIILEDAGVKDGTSVPNVQGFIRRQQKLGIIGEKGSNKEAFDRGIKEAAKLPSEPGAKKQPSPSLEQAVDQKTEGGPGATESHSSLSESLSSLSASTGQTLPSEPVAKLKAAVNAKKKKP